ncbi:hypothetical protein HGRIS_004001 [Hohenbuehelia grisea]|uniref:3'-5' exonuclease domain-containing protein n=1 Tax=Hohenbuehelia grisea TaxID=104357 RepID=A0ABR3JH60_9AGAR
MSRNAVTFCNNTALLSDALADLKDSTQVLFDCEGHDLGMRNPHLHDVLSLDDTALRPIFDILESSAVTKVVFDGRMDYSALYHEFHVEMKNVLDMQLADVKSRTVRGEGEQQQLQRLCPYLHKREVYGQRASYLHVHCLNGLAKCAREHDIPSIGVRPFLKHTRWRERPLPDDHVHYSAHDMAVLRAVHDRFLEKGFIDSDLKEQSARYITLCKSSQPKKNHSSFCSPLLPLGIIDYVWSASSTICSECQRNLPTNLFPESSLRNLKPQPKCWVCRALATRANLYRS